MLRVIRMCLRPNMDNGDNTTRPLVSLGCASGTNFTSGIIPILIFVLGRSERNVWFEKKIFDVKTLWIGIIY